jgi:4-diphosphocytidyl-2-C-methyl-D-erythritol kinase
VNDGTQVDTKWAYGAVDDVKRYAPVDAEAVLHKKKALSDILVKGEIERLSDFCRNDFEGPVFNAFPSVAGLKTSLCKGGADFSIMTGSGSTVIGLFRDRNNASRMHDNFMDKGISAWLTEFVAG